MYICSDKRFVMGKVSELFKQIFRPLLSPVFLTLLVASFILWYGIKLSHVYTTEMPITVSIDGRNYDVDCVVEAHGGTLWAQRLSLGSKINLKFDELSPRRSKENKGMYTIKPAVISNAIMNKNSALKIIEVVNIPEIEAPEAD